MSREALASRLQRTGLLELFDVGLLWWAFFAALGIPATIPNLIGYGLAAMHLLAGAVYWLLKGQQTRQRRRFPVGIGLFRWTRTACVFGLVGGLACIAARVPYQPGTRSLPGLGFWALALAEHVNYFHVQLVPDTPADLRRLLHPRKLRRSHLAGDLERWLVANR